MHLTIHLGKIGKNMTCISELILCFQDAHEFLSQCLDQLKEDMEKVNKSCRSDSSAWDEPQGTRIIEDMDTSRIYTCPVTVNMEFEVQHTITCKRWGLFGVKCNVIFFSNFCNLKTKLTRKIAYTFSF